LLKNRYDFSLALLGSRENFLCMINYGRGK
jgi:hypothetical protein